ncbi:MAG TPA: hypothetical protein QF753_01900 [Victivallales bacterium]|nr:hypothetical protein [Victivallales bacterium]
MERHSKKLYVKLFFTYIFLFFALTVKAADESGVMDANLLTFHTPQFNKKTNKLEAIISGTDAETVGSGYRLHNVVLQLIGKDGKSIEAVITTPIALYNQATGFISGDKWIKLKSLEYEAQGIGFDASQATDTLHIRSHVKLTIKNTGKKSSALDMGTDSSSNNKNNSKNKTSPITTDLKTTSKTATDSEDSENTLKDKSDIKNNTSQTPEDKTNA